MKTHGLPPLVGELEDGKVTWQSIKSVDYDTLGYLLSCHLIIEHYIDHYLETFPTASFGWKEARLTFAQKISLIAKLHFPEPYQFVPAIKHLNSLRNKFSHNIRTELSGSDLLPFIQCLEKWSQKAPAELPTEAKEILQLFTLVICAYFAGAITEHAGSKR